MFRETHLVSGVLITSAFHRHREDPRQDRNRNYTVRTGTSLELLEPCEHKVVENHPLRPSGVGSVSIVMKVIYFVSYSFIL